MADPREFRRGSPGGDTYDPERGNGAGLRPAQSNAANVFVPPPKSTMTDDAVRALATIEPALTGFLEKRERQLTEEELKAGRQAALEHAMEAGEAVRQGKLKPSESKWFMKGYKEQYGENVGQQWAMEAKVEWEQSEAKNSDDPQAVSKFLQEFTAKKLQDPAARDSDVRTGILPYLQKTRSMLTAAQAEYSANKVKETHLTNVGVAISDEIDQFRTGRINSDQLFQSIKQKDSAALLMGVSKDDMNKTVVQAVTAKARETNNLGLLDLLKKYPHVGNNPKYAQTIAATHDAIVSRSLTNENRALVAEQRRRIETERVGLTNVYSMLLDQHKKGEEIRLTPEVEAEMKRSGTPDAFTKTMSFIGTMRGEGERMSVEEINRLNSVVMRAGPHGLAAVEMMLPTIKNKEVLGSLLSLARANSDLTNDRTFVDYTNRILAFGGKDNFGRAIIDPMAAEDAANEFRARYATWVSQNPQANPQERDRYAAQVSSTIQSELDRFKMMNGNEPYQRNIQSMRGMTDEQLMQMALERQRQRQLQQQQQQNQPQPKK